MVEVTGTTHGVDRPGDVAVVEAALRGGRAPGLGLEQVRIVVLDVDGVMTDGSIAYLQDQQLATFDVKDGLGLTQLASSGVAIALVSGRDSAGLHRRAAELGLSDVRVGVADKALALTEIALSHGLTPSDALYVGDDQPDVAAMELAGWSAAPSDASLPARRAAMIQLSSPGGRGAVRELTDRVLAARRAALVDQSGGAR